MDYAGELVFWLRRVVSMDSKNTGGLDFEVCFTVVVVRGDAVGRGIACRGRAISAGFPPMTGSVVDAAQMLDSQTTVRLARLLSAHEKATGERVVVVTLADLQGTSIEEFGSRLGDAWGLGLHGKDDSVLLVVYRDKRKVFMEVGDVLKDRLNDAQASLIIDMLMTPSLTTTGLPSV